MAFKTRYNCRETTPGIVFKEDSLTLQSEYPATTIDYYLKKYSQTGLLGDPQRAAGAQYVDVTEIGDFADMQNKIRAVTEAFEQLPAEERRKYGDDVRTWVEAQMQAAVEAGGAGAAPAEGGAASAESASVAATPATGEPEAPEQA
uniref:Internal scaffolding protein n=1 Tax=Dulem virus 149 TaxID=3145626 RepID=A0AAU8AXB5_9VIRU